MRYRAAGCIRDGGKLRGIPKVGIKVTDFSFAERTAEVTDRGFARKEVVAIFISVSILDEDETVNRNDTSVFPRLVFVIPGTAADLQLVRRNVITMSFSPLFSTVQVTRSVWSFTS